MSDYEWPDQSRAANPGDASNDYPGRGTPMNDKPEPFEPAKMGLDDMQDQKPDPVRRPLWHRLINRFGNWLVAPNTAGDPRGRR